MTERIQSRICRWAAAIGLLCGLLLLAGAVSLCVGTADISIARIPTLLSGGGDDMERVILMRLRLPRILLGIAVGGGLSLAGVILQGMFRNPLVEPYTLGISGGAALGVCVAIAFRLAGSMGVWSLPAFGFGGAAAAVILVYRLSARRSVWSIGHMLLTGVMISFICSSLVMLIMAVARAEDLHGIIFWIMGSLDEPNMTLTWIATAVSVSGLGASYFFCLDLNALSLGEEEAQHLGVSVKAAKRNLFVIASVVTGVSVSVAGVIGFVGLVVPHFMRLILGPDHRILLVSTFLCGGAFLVICDTLARTVVDPIELPVGVITGIVGGSVFVYALSRRRV